MSTLLYRVTLINKNQPFSFKKLTGNVNKIQHANRSLARIRKVVCGTLAYLWWWVIQSTYEVVDFSIHLDVEEKKENFVAILWYLRHENEETV